jgi:alkylation response protein AidB-like acyl-CoA dehydrogenase
VATRRPSAALAADVRAVAKVLDAEADETERLRTLSPAAVDALRSARLFWLLVPRELGGLGGDARTAIEVFERLSRADPSSGWSLMANSLLTGLAAAFMGDDAVDALFGGTDLPIMAGMLGPGGSCVEVDGGYVGSGHYSFGSGALHSQWLGAGMLVMDGGRPRMAPDGQPDSIVCIVPRERVELLDNWDVSGLVGTGSVDYDVPELFVEQGYTFHRNVVDPLRGGPLFGMGIVGFGCAGHAGVALGIAARALEEISLIARAKKRPGRATYVADDPLFRHAFSTNEAAYQSARAFVHEVYADAQATLVGGGQLSAVQRQRFRQAATYSHDVTAAAVRFAYLAAGSNSLREPSVLGRCMRDMYAATQHVFVDPTTMVDAAPALLDHWSVAAEELNR